MEITVGSKVFYPSHGAGWAKRKKKIEFGGEEKDYIEFEFINSRISVSTPIDNVDSLGIRHVHRSKDIRKIIAGLKKKKREDPRHKDFNDLANKLKELEDEATIESFIKIIQYCNDVVANRAKEGRLIPVTIDKHRKVAIEYIAGELAVSDGVDYENGLKSFERASAMNYSLK
jgi:RNA polymerase-interacting CarD/CdnL/TRCF family regulator